MSNKICEYLKFYLHLPQNYQIQSYMVEKNATMAKKRYSFRNAFGRIPKCESKAAKEALCVAMGIDSSANTWSIYKNYGFNPRLDVYLRVNAVFAGYGIDDCWEEVPYNGR